MSRQTYRLSWLDERPLSLFRRIECWHKLTPPHLAPDFNFSIVASSEILRLRAIYRLSLDEFRGLYVSDDQINQLIDRTLNHQSPNTVTAELTERADALRISIEQQGRESPWTAGQ
jgi:hypothetical protein